MKKAIINVRLYDYEQYIENGYIIYDDKIISVGKMEDFVDDEYQIKDGSGEWLLPSFVVGHTHIYSTFARGWSPDFNPKNFQDILDQLWWKLDKHLDNQATYYSGIVHAIDALKNGVTTIIDHHASGKDISGSLTMLKNSVIDTVGLRGLFCFETSDRFNVDEAIQENVNFLKSPLNKTSMVSGHFGLHASMSLSEATLKKVSKVLNQEPIHIHVAESELDEADALKKYNQRIIDRLARHNLLTEDSIITHGLFMNDEEIALLKKHKCVVALNVTSNMNNAVGLPNYLKLKKHGVPVILGNDGLSTTIATEYLTILYAMHLKERSPTAFGLEDLLSIIKNTYAYVSKRLNTKLGKLQSGYQADFMLVPYAAPTPIDASNAFGHLVYGLMHSFKPKSVYINGVEKVSNYTVSKHLMNKYKEASHVSTKLWKRIRNEEEL